jgi:hypothetical protein
VTKAKKKASPSSPKEKSSADSHEGSQLQEYPQTETGSVDKIRDLIFGNQMKDYDKRFAHLEEGLRRQLSELRNATDNRLDSIEAFIKKEIEALSDRLKTEQSMRVESAKELSKEIKDSTRLISKNIEQLEEKQSKDSRDLRQQLLDMSKNLSSEIAKKQNEASRALDRAVKELDEDKVARSTLSELLMELAVRTSNELAEKLNLEADGLKNA